MPPMPGDPALLCEAAGSVAPAPLDAGAVVATLARFAPEAASAAAEASALLQDGHGSVQFGSIRRTQANHVNELELNATFCC